MSGRPKVRSGRCPLLPSHSSLGTLVQRVLTVCSVGLCSVKSDPRNPHRDVTRIGVPVAPSSKTMRALLYTRVSVETFGNVACTRQATTLVSLQTLRLLHASSTWTARWKHQHLALFSPLRMRLLNLDIFSFHPPRLRLIGTGVTYIGE